MQFKKILPTICRTYINVNEKERTRFVTVCSKEAAVEIHCCYGKIARRAANGEAKENDLKSGKKKFKKEKTTDNKYIHK